MDSISKISRYLGLPIPLIEEVMKFLCNTGLCLKKEDERYQMGPASTHLESTSKFIGRHHVNWRLKTLEQQHSLSSAEDLIFTAPLTISRKDASWVRERLIGLIQEISKVTRDSPAEELRCLNLDWVQVRSKSV